MIGHRFTEYIPEKDQKGTDFDNLFQIFTQLITITSGDANEALSWLTELDRQHNLTKGAYGIGDFIEDLKSKGFLTDKTEDGSFRITAKSEQAVRKNALEEIFGKLKKVRQGKPSHQLNGRRRRDWFGFQSVSVWRLAGADRADRKPQKMRRSIMALLILRLQKMTSPSESEN